MMAGRRYLGDTKERCRCGDPHSVMADMDESTGRWCEEQGYLCGGAQDGDGERCSGVLEILLWIDAIARQYPA